MGRPAKTLPSPPRSPGIGSGPQGPGSFLLGDPRFLQEIGGEAVRSCEVCGASIEHRRPQAKTCDDRCRKLLSLRNRDNG